MNGLNIKTALSVTRKDIKILIKERGILLYLFVIPILFIMAFGGAAGMGSDPKEEAVLLPVVNLDEGSEASGTLLETLNQSGGIECETYDYANAKTNLDKGKINRVLTIPANYGADLQAGNHVTLLLVNGSDANPAKTEAVHKVVAGVAADLSLEMQLIASFRQMADMQAAVSPDQQIFTSEIIVEQVQNQFTRSRTEPLLGLEETWPEHLDEEQEINPISLYVPGFAVLFIFLTAQATAQSIYEEKKNGSFRRLLAAPISKVTILVGKMTPNFITGLAQIIILFSAGVYLFPLLGLDSLSLGNDLLALVLISLVVLLCSTSLGVLIAAIARTEGQISGLSSVVLWVFGFAGIWLIQIPPTPLFDKISQAIPHYWANTAYLDLFVRRLSLVDIIPNIGILLGFTAVFFVIGLWRFDFN
jgi:ABC-2 type transport system permease protein